MIELYTGLSERAWNTVPVPETAGPFMVSSGRPSDRVAPGCAPVMNDSGAFNDESRLSFAGALDRQLAFEATNSFTSSALVAYDWLIDEKWNDGRRRKVRWTEDEAEIAVQTTIHASEFLAGTDVGPRRRVCPIQGVTARQQTYCAEAVIPITQQVGGILGLGGWCIVGWAPYHSDMRRALECVFWDSMWSIIPRAAQCGIQHIHIFGVMVPALLGGLRWIADQFGIATISTDSSGPSTRPAKNGLWGYGDWLSKCWFPPGPERGMARIEHVRQVRTWLARMRKTQYYREPPRPTHYQMRLF